MLEVGKVYSVYGRFFLLLKVSDYIRCYCLDESGKIAYFGAPGLMYHLAKELL